MKKLVFVLGFGLSIILAGCSSNPGPFLSTFPSGTPAQITPAPIVQATATSNYTTVAVPDLCKFVTESEAAEILGLVSNIHVPSDVATMNTSYGNSSSLVNGMRYYSVCEQDGTYSFGGGTVWTAGLYATCSSQVLVGGATIAPSYMTNWLEGRREYLIG